MARRGARALTNLFFVGAGRPLESEPGEFKPLAINYKPDQTPATVAPDRYDCEGARWLIKSLLAKHILDAEGLSLVDVEAVNAEMKSH